MIKKSDDKKQTDVTNENQADVQMSDEQIEEPSQEDKLAALTAQLKRALADYQNLQRRVQEERIMIGQFATQSLLLELLPIVDNLDQTVETAPNDEKNSVWFKAVEISVKQLKDILKNEGVEDLAPDGKQFDPNEHEAVDTVAGEEDDKVAQVLQKGYKLHGKVIRAAKVRVSKRSS